MVTKKTKALASCEAYRERLRLALSDAERRVAANGEEKGESYAWAFGYLSSAVRSFLLSAP